MADSAERRKADVDMHSKIDAMIGMLTLHMTKEEIDIGELKEKIDNYFHELDAHTHLFHHNKVAAYITKKERNTTRWEKITTGMMEKALTFVLGGIAMYIVALIWLDFGNKINSMPNPPQTIPAIVQPQVPKANLNVPTSP